MPSFRLVTDETSGLTRLREDPPTGPLSQNSPFRTVLEWTGIVGLALFVLALGALIGLFEASARLDAESKTFAETSIKAIALDWDKDALMARSSPDLLAESPAQVDALFASLYQLGAGARLEACRGGSAVAFRGIAAPTITALYDCDLDLKDGQAEADIGLRYVSGAWKVSAFRMNSPLLR
jgi:hypothetical protein